MKTTSSRAAKQFPYSVRPAQAVGQWTVQIDVGSARFPAKVTAAVGSKEECEVAAAAWNLLARGKLVQIVEKGQ